MLFTLSIQKKNEIFLIAYRLSFPFAVPDRMVPLRVCWPNNKTERQMVLSEVFTGSQEEIKSKATHRIDHRQSMNVVTFISSQSFAFYFILHHNKQPIQRHSTHFTSSLFFRFTFIVKRLREGDTNVKCLNQLQNGIAAIDPPRLTSYE